MSELFDFSQASLWLSAASIVFNPTFWNIAARQEYHNKVITKLFGGNPRYGCYALAVAIFSVGILRDYLYHQALINQPTHPFLEQAFIKQLSWPIFISGNILVVTSMWALGVTGTYLGDYFGILMDAPVTSFPFNVTEAPMYHGSTLSFLATALWLGRPAGILLTVLVWAMYTIARQFEDPFTSEIYAKRERERKADKKSS